MPNKIQKTYFMLRKFLKDITREREIYKLSEEVQSEKLGEYYFIMTEEQMLAGHSQKYHFDEDGIPIIPSYIDVEEQKLVYYPISIGQYGLAIWNTYLKTGSESDKIRFLKIADWFYQNRIEERRLGAFWLTDVDKPAYRIYQPWKSAFSQARAINILLRAFQITGKNEYEEIADKSLKLFQIKVEEGGICCPTPSGPFYEEYPAEVPVLVLNGHIFALCGVYDFVRTHPSHKTARKIFDDGVNTLAKILPEFDMTFWSRYSLCKAPFHPDTDPSTIGYHHLHIIQLRLMFKLTGNPVFEDFANRWESYVSKKNILKMYLVKYKALKQMKRL